LLRRARRASGSSGTSVDDVWSDPLLASINIDRFRSLSTRCGRPFTDLFPDLPNPQADRRRRDQAYHALCVMAGNFSRCWLKLFGELERRFDIPASAPYRTGPVAANLVADGHRLPDLLPRDARRCLRI
jgi:hypothetical protein